MPAALAVDWNEVRTLALAVGVREAARQMGIEEFAVLKRSQREDWLEGRQTMVQKLAAAKAIVREKQGLSSTVLSAADCIAKLDPDTKLGHAIAANKVSRKVREMDADELFLSAPALLATAKHAATVHNWSATTIAVGINLGAMASAAMSAQFPAEE